MSEKKTPGEVIRNLTCPLQNPGVRESGQGEFEKVKAELEERRKEYVRKFQEWRQEAIAKLAAIAANTTHPTVPMLLSVLKNLEPEDMASVEDVDDMLYHLAYVPKDYPPDEVVQMILDLFRRL
jgi:hypothetical protein